MVPELRRWWKIIRTAILMIGFFLCFFAFVEVLHVYTVLRNVWPPLGYAFLLLVTTGCILFLVYIFIKIGKRPRVLRPPDIEDLASASPEECHAYCLYLIQYLERLIRNPNFPDENIEIARMNMDLLEKLILSHQQPSALLEEIDKTEKEIIEPLLSKLDEKAEAEVRKSVRDIMIGVTLSPYRTVDLLIVIYRNASMVKRVMWIYNSRPLLAEQFSIFMDVLRVVVLVNYMSFGQKLMEQFLYRVPYIGRVLDDFAEGVGAALLTSVAGHGAIYRCRSYERWDQKTAVQTISSMVKGFMNDVKDMFKQDLLPKMRNKVYSTAPSDKTADPVFWEKTTKGISSALDDTESIIDALIKKPVIAGSKGTIKVGSAAISKSTKAVIQGANGLWKGTKSVALGTGRGVRFTGSTIFKAFNYTGDKIRKMLQRKNKGV
jgi:putative membrane protein